MRVCVFSSLRDLQFGKVENKLSQHGVTERGEKNRPIIHISVGQVHFNFIFFVYCKTIIINHNPVTYQLNYYNYLSKFLIDPKNKILARILLLVK